MFVFGINKELIYLFIYFILFYLPFDFVLCSIYVFFFHSSCRKDQFTVLIKHYIYLFYETLGN